MNKIVGVIVTYKPDIEVLDKLIESIRKWYSLCTKCRNKKGFRE